MKIAVVIRCICGCEACAFYHNHHNSVNNNIIHERERSSIAQKIIYLSLNLNFVCEFSFDDVLVDVLRCYFRQRDGFNLNFNREIKSFSFPPRRSHH